MAISSELTNSLHFSISGKIVKEAVVFPAPLQPDIIYKYGTVCCFLMLQIYVISFFNMRRFYFSKIVKNVQEMYFLTNRFVGESGGFVNFLYPK
mgnify:CR=1 FL=1